jgi:drug/metabolite transporter (DMT)-like permease
MKRKLFALIILYVAWGTTYLAIRYAVETIPPFFMSGMRFLTAGVILYGWRKLAGDPTPTRSQWIQAGIIGLLLLVGGIGGVALAEQYVPSGIAALIVAAAPLWVVLVEFIQPNGNRPTWQPIMAVLAGLAGIAILIGPLSNARAGTGYNITGITILLTASILWSVGSVLSHKVNLPQSPLMGTSVELLAGGAGSLVLAMMLGEWRTLDFQAISTRSLAGLGYVIVVGSLVGFVCYTWLLRVAPTRIVMTYAYVNPLVAVMLGSLVAHETLTPNVLIATPLILAAVVMSHTRGGTRLVNHETKASPRQAAGKEQGLGPIPSRRTTFR